MDFETVEMQFPIDRYVPAGKDPDLEGPVRSVRSHLTELAGPALRVLSVGYADGCEKEGRVGCLTCATLTLRMEVDRERLTDYAVRQMVERSVGDAGMNCTRG